MILCFALGIANLFNFTRPVLIVFSAICLYALPCPTQNENQANTETNRSCSFIILFVEVPFLLRICPTSGKFDDFIRKFTTSIMRAAVYGVMSLIQWLSLISHASSLIAAAVFLLITAICYTIAAVRKDEFMSSKTLGGQGVAQMIV